MRRRHLDLNDKELAVIQVIWKYRSATIRQITDEIYVRRTVGEYATVQKLLERLESKGYVKRDRSTFAHQFTSLVDRSELIGQGIQQLADKLCDGSLTPVLTHLVEARKLSERDREMLRDLISDDSD